MSQSGPGITHPSSFIPHPSRVARPLLRRERPADRRTLRPAGRAGRRAGILPAARDGDLRRDRTAAADGDAELVRRPVRPSATARLGPGHH
jgi:hypothetical protein